MKLKENRPPEPAVVLALVAGLGFVYGITDPNLADPTQVVRSAQASTAPQGPPPAKAEKTKVAAKRAPLPVAGSLPDFPRHVDRANCRVEEILDPDSRSMLTYHFREKQIRHRDGGKTEKVIPFARLDDAGERHAKALQRELPKNCRTL